MSRLTSASQRRRAAALLIALGLGASVLAQAPRAKPGAAPSDRPVAQPAEHARAAGADSAAAALRPRTTLALLNQRLPAMTFDDVSLDAALAQLESLAQTTISVRWGRLTDLGIPRDRPISIRMPALAFRDALQLVLKEAAADGERLAYRAISNLVVVSTAEDFGNEQITQVYDINDLLVEEVSIPEASFGRVNDIVRGIQPRVAEGAVGVEPIIESVISGTNVRIPDGRRGFGGGGGGNDPNNIFRRLDEDGEGDNRAEFIAQLIAGITVSIEPESWAVNGGRGTIREFRGLLIIRNSPFVHQAIGGPLKDTGPRR